MITADHQIRSFEPLNDFHEMSWPSWAVIHSIAADAANFSVSLCGAVHFIASGRARVLLKAFTFIVPILGIAASPI